MTLVITGAIKYISGVTVAGFAVLSSNFINYGRVVEAVTETEDYNRITAEATLFDDFGRITVVVV